MKIIIFTLAAMILQGCSLVGIRTVELLDFEIIEKDGNFDIRHYDDYWVARTEIDGNYQDSSNRGFRLLFDYISGKNGLKEKISLTGPVLRQEKGEKIAMTGPVIQQKKGKSWTMEFVLPSRYNKLQPPEPLDPEVSIVKVSGYKAAAISYSGNLGEEKYNTKIKDLLHIVNLKGLQPIGEPFSAGYDPPWTIPFLKRNEVLIIIE